MPRSRRTIPDTPSRFLSFPENSPSFQRAQLQCPEILHKNRRTVLREDHDIAEILQRPDQPDSTHDVTLLAADHNAAAGVRVVGLNRGNHLLE